MGGRNGGIQWLAETPACAQTKAAPKLPAMDDVLIDQVSRLLAHEATDARLRATRAGGRADGWDAITAAGLPLAFQAMNPPSKWCTRVKPAALSISRA